MYRPKPHLMGTASIQSLELGCCTKKPETAGFACTGAEAGGAVAAGAAAGGPDDATSGSEGCGVRCAASGCALTGALPGMPMAGSRIDCEALESTVIAEPAAGPLPLGNALSHDRTCHTSCNTSTQAVKHHSTAIQPVKSSSSVTKGGDMPQPKGRYSTGAA